jgi:phytoene dehydrogenase-like protein
MNAKMDVVVIGGGHNGLAAACLLAEAGKKVTLVEKRDALGGLAAAVEFAPGFRSAGVWPEAGSVSRAVLSALGLDSLVQDEAPEIYALGLEGGMAPIAGAADRTAFGVAQHAAADGRGYTRYANFMQRIRPVMEKFLTSRPLNLLAVEDESPLELLTRAFGLRRLGAPDMVELLRVAPMPVSDFLNEYFESDFVKGALAMNAVLGTFTAPRSPGTTMNLLLHEALAGQSIRGGSPALTEALEQRARDLGVLFRTCVAVTAIRVEKNAVTGVELEDGMFIEAAAVSASCNPKTVLLDLLPVSALTHTTEHRISNFRTRGTAAQALFALDGPVGFSDGSTEQQLARVRIAPSLDYVEKAFDAVKYNRFSAEPALDISVPSLDNPGLAPSGKHVMSVLVNYVPYELDGGWTEAAKSELLDTVVATIARHAPAFKASIVASKLLTPADLDLEYGLTGGSLYHGEPGIDQMMIRPIPECLDHATPVHGLSLCGSGTHPGGTVACMAGSLAAGTILRSNKARAENAA